MRCYSIVAAAALLATANIHVSAVETYHHNKPEVIVPLSLEDNTFYGDIQLGTPEQKFRVKFDTGTGLTWLPSTECSTYTCQGQPLYDPSQSSTACPVGRSLTVEYDNGECVEATLYNDTLMLTGEGKATFESFTLGAAYAVTGTDEPAAGVLGLGGEHGASNFYKRGLVKRGGSFGKYRVPVSFAKVAKGSGPLRKRYINPEWVFTVGILESSYIGRIRYFPLPPADDLGTERFWKTYLTCITVGREFEFTPSPETLVSFNTGKKVITVPTQQADSLHQAIGATYDAKDGRYVLKCSHARRLPRLEFFLTGHKVSLPPKLWTAQVDPTDTDEDCLCYTLIGRSNGDEWVFGTALTKNFVTILDDLNERIGLAIPRIGSDGARITQI